MMGQKGITLLVLVITIIILLIIGAISIIPLKNDLIIRESKNAVRQQSLVIEKDEIQAKILEWKTLRKYTNKTLYIFLSEQYGEESIKLLEDKNIILIMPTENQYLITQDGNVILQ